MKALTLTFLFLSFLADNDKDLKSAPVMDELKKISDNMKNNTFGLQTELKSKMKHIEGMIDMSFSAIDEESIRNTWREGLSVQRDTDFDASIVFYKLKEIQEFPCKSINFLFNIKTDLEVYNFNADKYFLCWLKFNDEIVKSILSDVVVEAVINILKSGFSNPISTFFSNVLIIEGPKKLKDELFGSFYRYVDENQELNTIYSKFKDIVVKIGFDPVAFETERQNFVRLYSTTMIFFLYDMIIVYLKNNDIYMSAYDFIQPEANLITNPNSLDPKYLSENYMKILEEDLEKFKSIRSSYKENAASTVFHKSYAKYVDKNIKILCKYLFKKKDC